MSIFLFHQNFFIGKAVNAFGGLGQIGILEK